MEKGKKDKKKKGVFQSEITRRDFLKVTGGISLLGVTGVPFIVPKKALAQNDVIKIGMTVALTGPQTDTGLAISRGAQAGMDFINKKGGVLGKKLELIVLDDSGLPPNAVANTRRLATRFGCAAIMGGFHSTVGLAMRAPIHEIKIPYISPYCGNTQIIENGYKPNYMFRCSVKMSWMSEFLVDFAVNALGKKKVAVLNENTGWGSGGEKDILKVLDNVGIKPVGVEMFNWGDKDMTPQLMRLRSKGAEVLVGYYLDPEGAQLAKSMRKIEYRPEIVTGMGIVSQFAELTGNEVAEGFLCAQTYSWCGKLERRGQEVYDYIRNKFKMAGDCREFKAGSGTAGAFDSIHLLALGIEAAGTCKVPECWAKIRDALEKKVKFYDGLMARYSPPFEESDNRHDALLPENYQMCAWHNGFLMPMTQTPHWKKVLPEYQKKYLENHPRERERLGLT